MLQTWRTDTITKTRHVRWNNEVDGIMINALVHQVLAGHKRSDITSFQVSKASERVTKWCRVVVSEKNVRAQLKTLKREYAEVSQPLSISGFGWDAETGRITADSLAWDELVKGKPEFGSGGPNCVVIMMKWRLFLETTRLQEIGLYRALIISRRYKLKKVLTSLTL